jgi:biopolymer transport protein ExbD
MSMRRRELKSGTGIEVELPIVPFLDMTFQILFFFIMNYHPSALEGQLDLSLPAAGEAKAQAMEDVDVNKLPDNEIELKSEVTVIIRTPHDNINDGTISQIVIAGDQGEFTVPNVEGLERYLKTIQKDLTNKTDIKIQADSRLKYYFVVQIMDACVKAGYPNVGFAPPPDLGFAP